MADWLRPVFARSKTPLASAVSVVSQDANEPEVAPLPRSKPASRVTSYVNLHHSTTPLPASDSFLSFRASRNPETIYHKPSGDQMAEMVKVVMMNQSSLDPIPVQYNSAILHVLESYHELCVELGKKEELVLDLKQSYTKDIKDFETLTKDWEEKEKDYKTELRNLEILLSRTDGGLEKVSLARTKSTIHGAVRASDSIGNRIATIKEKHSARNTRHKGRLDNMSWELDTNDPNRTQITGEKLLHPYVIPRKTRRTRMNETTNVDQSTTKKPSHYRVLNTKSSDESFHKYSSPPEMNAKWKRPTQDQLRLTKAQLEDLEQQQAELAINESFGSSLSGSSSMLRSFHTMEDESESLRTHVKPVPATPIDGMLINTRHSMYEGAPFDLSGSRSKPPSQMGFSFNPGDDTDLDTLAAGLGGGGVLHLALPKAVAQPQPSIGPVKSVARTSISPLHVYKDNKDNGSLARYDSTSSVITAVRHNSGKSTNAGSLRNSLSGLPQPSTTPGGSDAMAAAVRAFAGSSASKIPRKSPSGSAGITRRGSSEVLGQVGSGDARVDLQTGSGEVYNTPQHQRMRGSVGGNRSAKSNARSVLETPVKKGSM